jgi:hypothetical protein
MLLTDESGEEEPRFSWPVVRLGILPLCRQDKPKAPLVRLITAFECVHRYGGLVPLENLPPTERQRRSRSLPRATRWRSLFVFHRLTALAPAHVW